MLAIARFAMRSPMAASINAAAYAVFALFVAPSIVVSGAIIGLATLRFGATEGLRISAIAVLIAGVAYFILLQQPGAALLLGVIWIPVMVAGWALRASESQGLAMTVCAAFAALYAFAARVILPDMTAHWMEWLKALGEMIQEQGGTFYSAEEIATIAGVMHEATIVLACLYGMTAILLARYWQAGLYNPGGFGDEFRSLCLPRVVSLIAALIAVFALVQLTTGGIHGLLGDLLIVLVVLLSFQGIALIHHRLHKVTMANWWIVGFYVLLALMSLLMGLIGALTMLAFVGILDTVADIRRLRRGDD